jgi:pilus assembly protein CpaB
MSTGSVKVKAARFGALGFMAVALGCAALAAFVVGDMMSAEYTGSRVVPVVVASAELRAGEPLAAHSLEVRDWPEDAVPPGAFHGVEALLEAHEGASVTVGILPGEPVTQARLAANQTGTGVAALIRPNMRGFAMKVDDSIGFTGLVYPGAYVDLIATVRDPMGRGPSARIAVQNARVLSVGMDADVATRKMAVKKTDKLSGTASDGGTFVTLEVTPAEAEILAVAKREGTVDLVLRNATDDRVIDTDGATPNAFSAFAPAPEAEGAEPTAGKTARADRKVRVKRNNRRIQLVASDEPDTPTAKPAKNTSAIETYHAN